MFLKKKPKEQKPDESDTEDRQPFINDVLLTVSKMLAWTILVALLVNIMFIVVDILEVFFIWLSINLLILLEVIFYKEETYRNLLLFLYTSSQGLIVAIAFDIVPPPITAFAVALTTVTVSALYFIYKLTEQDFTKFRKWRLRLVILIVVLLLVKDIPQDAAFDVFLTIIIAILVSCFVIADIQMTIGGDYTTIYSTQENMKAIICLYIDIFVLFYQILWISILTFLTVFPPPDEETLSVSFLSDISLKLKQSCDMLIIAKFTLQ